MGVDATAKQYKREPGPGGDRGSKPALSRARTASKSLSPGFLALARSLDALLVQPIAVLPQTPSDLIKPFKLGVRPEIEALRRPEVSEAKLAAALRSYAKSVAYQSALARHGSMRHELNGTPVELVSDEDRQSAARDLQARREKWARQRAAAAG